MRHACALCGMSCALRIENLWKSYTAGVRGCSVRVWALRACFLDVGVGERVAIVGGAGAGKTTLLHCIAGTRRVDAGRVRASIPIRWAGSAEGDDTIRMVVPALQLLEGAYPATLERMPPGSAIVTSRDVASVHGLVDRILLLRDGRLTTMNRIAVRRVAEPSTHDRGPHVR